MKEQNIRTKPLGWELGSVSSGFYFYHILIMDDIEQAIFPCFLICKIVIKMIMEIIVMFNECLLDAGIINLLAINVQNFWH